ncbi:hypothetical protein E2C01_083273 [Portunus trituberculatus]|uniref:Uncharacterized protein n=1 Tax=Portunus trituberculatus TaxID=210409 RepID=A0A5B7IWS6_PORTR|nr:hypothetical protein [Portunus trituberculatus]
MGDSRNKGCVALRGLADAHTLYGGAADVPPERLAPKQHILHNTEVTSPDPQPPQQRSQGSHTPRGAAAVAEGSGGESS